MSQYIEGPTRTFEAGAALSQYLRVKLTAGLLAAAGVGDIELGTLCAESFASGDMRAVRLRTAEGTGIFIASEAITEGSNVYAAASGKVAASGSIMIGIALTAATADGDQIEVLRNQSGAGTIPTEVVTATNAIAASESGSTFFLNSATEFVSTLPAPAAGLNFEFIVSAAPSGASYTIVTTSSANIIKGQVYTLDVDSATNPDFETSGGDTISFVDAKAVAGDRVVLRCDGTNWFAYGFCSVFDAITITTAS